MRAEQQKHSKEHWLRESDKLHYRIYLNIINAHKCYAFYPTESRRKRLKRPELQQIAWMYIAQTPAKLEEGKKPFRCFMFRKQPDFIVFWLVGKKANPTDHEINWKSLRCVRHLHGASCPAINVLAWGQRH